MNIIKLDSLVPSLSGYRGMLKDYLSTQQHHLLLDTEETFFDFNTRGITEIPDSKVFVQAYYEQLLCADIVGVKDNINNSSFSDDIKKNITKDFNSYIFFFALYGWLTDDSSLSVSNKDWDFTTFRPKVMYGLYQTQPLYVLSFCEYIFAKPEEKELIFNQLPKKQKEHIHNNINRIIKTNNLN